MDNKLKMTKDRRATPPVNFSLECLRLARNSVSCALRAHARQEATVLAARASLRRAREVLEAEEARLKETASEVEKSENLAEEVEGSVDIIKLRTEERYIDSWTKGSVGSDENTRTTLGDSSSKDKKEKGHTDIIDNFENSHMIMPLLTLTKQERETFDRLTERMCDNKISSRDNLELIVSTILSLAINEQCCEKRTMYAEYCKWMAELSKEAYSTDDVCKKDAVNNKRFKHILLKMCQQEFEVISNFVVIFPQKQNSLLSILLLLQKQKSDIYDESREQKTKYLEKKSTVIKEKQEKTEEELELRRINFKKQRAGLILFIGKLYKIGVLSEKIIHDCIQSLLKISIVQYAGVYTILTNLDNCKIDAEDHEVLNKFFIEIGNKINNPRSKDLMSVYFKRILAMSSDTSMPSRTRFMYQDLIDKHNSNWESKEEKKSKKRRC